ncbi:P-loop containing nucleoside triphosphate hydrolases superfamily protein isoform 1 [Hibiscus syriacus]|uniref:P-loop containing nucleoside triphosphate hydrolases superfamily protein isoform 1 n=1 Tax=Hibiscus syriacus TaxID=106335 RepID=A0A6A3BG01_HIBSY|nr:P-loop containing nucleoside triphosphate hydrolases superfamily protein isoform 1 [Hibiscus syriacus]
MDGKKRKATVPWRMMVMFFLVLSANFPSCSSAASQQPDNRKTTHTRGPNGFRSSFLFPVTGNAVISLGSNAMRLAPVLLSVFHFPDSPRCDKADDQCDFEIDYFDHGSVLGVVVSDVFSLRFMNGSLARLHLTFGCAYDIKNPGPYSPPEAGVLGLSNGKASLLSQLRSFELTRNVICHCLSGKGGGFLFIGDDLVPSRMSWMPMLANFKKYLSSPAEVLFDGKPTGIKDLKLVFDSGSSYTYLNFQVYEAVLNLVRRGLNGKPFDTVEDKALPICWKGTKPFKSVHDVKNRFSTLTLSFTDTPTVQLELQPEAYLIVTEDGNACFGILNGTEAGFSSLDSYYNEDFQQPYATNFGIVDENSPKT